MSTLATVKKALFTELAARPSLDHVQVSYGTPTAYNIESDCIFFGPAEALHHEISMRGGKPFPIVEDYHLQINVQAFTLETDGFESADERAVFMLGEVEAVVSDNAQTIPGVMMLQLASWQHHVTETEASGSGYISRFELQVRIRAQLN